MQRGQGLEQIGQLLQQLQQLGGFFRTHLLQHAAELVTEPLLGLVQGLMPLGVSRI